MGRRLKRFLMMIRSSEYLSSRENRAGGENILARTLPGWADWVGLPARSSFCSCQLGVGGMNVKMEKLITYLQGVDTVALIVEMVHQIHGTVS